MALIQQRTYSYIKDALSLLKFVAFHQIYEMEDTRQILCRDTNFDCSVAFNSLDIFKHNKISAEEVYLFLQTKNFQATIFECNQLVRSLNKNALFIDFGLFQQMVLCQKLELKDQSLSRMASLKPEIGTYQKVLSIKQWSERKITDLLQKEIQFAREYLYKRQQFVTRWSGDVYTISQQFFLGKLDMIDHSSFQALSRKYGIIFNKNEFSALLRRSKGKYQVASSQQDFLKKQSFWILLVTQNLSLKQKFGLEQQLPLAKIFERRPSSYEERAYRQPDITLGKRDLEIRHILSHNPANIKIKYSYYIPQQILLPLLKQYQIQHRDIQWKQQLAKMSVQQIDRRYYQTHKRLSVKNQPPFYK